MGMLDSIKETLKEHPEITVISFDLFDTILFRMLKEPADIFSKTAEQALKSGYLLPHVTPLVYKNIRIEAEKKARKIKREKNNTPEVTLKEITDCIPGTICKEKNNLAGMELRTEMSFCYLNPEMADVAAFLKEWKKDGRKLIITSDMYLSSEEEKILLNSNGLDTGIFDQIIVSSECFCSKAQGGLYFYVLEKLQIKSEELLHIGDNYMTDIVNAQYAGIHTIYYDLPSYHYTELQMEELKYGNPAPEILSLRKFSRLHCSLLNEEDSFWFRTGFMFMGPLMTGMSEWVLDTAEQAGIKNIYPLMREGMIFSRLLKQAMEYRKTACNITPLYVSRKSTFLPSMADFSEDEFEQIISIKHGTLETVFEMLELPWKNSIFEPDISIPLSDIRKKNLYGKLKHYLLSENIKTEIKQTIQKKSGQILQYFSETGLTEEPFITVDIGVRGSIPYAIEKILRKQKNNHKNIHLMTFGNYDCIEKILDDVDIRGYVSSFGENDGINFMFVQKSHILEQFLMCEHGTTTGYVQDERGKMIPLLKKTPNLEGQQLKNIKTIQDGMMAFQKMYLALKQGRPAISAVETKSEELAEIAMRFLSLPTQEEAWKIGELCVDENFGVDKIMKICKETTADQTACATAQEYIRKHPPGSIKWLEGSVTRMFPTYYLDKMTENNLSQYENLLVQIVKKAADKNIKKAVIVGAGEAGKKIYHYLTMYGIRAEAFTDNNPKLQGKQVYGIPVKTLKDDFQNNNYIVASFAFAEELKVEIMKEKGDNVQIFSCLD